MNNRTKFIAISHRTKDAVRERDGDICLWCHRRYGLPEAHFISRAHGGLGVERNILTLCRICHNKYDQGTEIQRAEMRDFFREYLTQQYEDWNENQIIYRKDL